MNNELSKYRDMNKNLVELQLESRRLKEQSKKLYEDSCKLTKKSREIRATIINEVSEIIVAGNVDSNVLDVATYILDNDDSTSNKANFLYRMISQKVKNMRSESQSTKTIS